MILSNITWFVLQSKSVTYIKCQQRTIFLQIPNDYFVLVFFPVWICHSSIELQGHLTHSWREQSCTCLMAFTQYKGSKEARKRITGISILASLIKMEITSVSILMITVEIFLNYSFASAAQRAEKVTVEKLQFKFPGGIPQFRIIRCQTLAAVVTLCHI